MSDEAQGDWQFATRAIHVGQDPDPLTGAVVPPIYQTSTFALDDIDVDRGYRYSRRSNPTRKALEECLASLEGGSRALAFASGMAATTAAAQLLKAGDRALIIEDAYGNTRQLFARLLPDHGVVAEFADLADPATLADALEREPRLVWLESPTNPLMRVVDITQVAEQAHRAGAMVIVDNTLASPYLQRPLHLGADLVAYSTTKYLGGHSDVVGGALVTRDAALGERLAWVQYVTGAIAGPLDAWLVLRGIKTLSLRMEQHSANAMHLARALERHPAVARVRYPGLESHPQHGLAARQMRRFGGMLSFELRGGREAVSYVVRHTRLFAFGASLGGVESLIGHPASMTHASMTRRDREAIGISDGLMRVSAGIEDPGDLERDLIGALDGLPPGAR